jgi:hypothetical protein
MSSQNESNDLEVTAITISSRIPLKLCYISLILNAEFDVCPQFKIMNDILSLLVSIRIQLCDFRFSIAIRAMSGMEHCC